MCIFWVKLHKRGANQCLHPPHISWAISTICSSVSQLSQEPGRKLAQKKQMISAGLEKCCCECQTQHGREKQQAAIAPCPSFMQALIKMHHSVQTRGLVIPTFSLIWVGIDLRESHWSSRSETRGWVSVEGLALTRTELMKLCTQTAHGHVTGALVQHTRFAKSLEKTTTELLQHVTAD